MHKDKAEPLEEGGVALMISKATPEAPYSRPISDVIGVALLICVIL
jgi:hypothetical protein